MPVSPAQYNASIGSYQSKVYKNNKRNNCENICNTQGKNAINTDEIHQASFRKFFNGIVNDHTEMNRRSIPPIPPLFVTVISLLNQFQLANMAAQSASADENSIMFWVSDNTSYSHQANKGSGAVLSQVPHTQRETVPFISSHGSRRFKRSGAAVLPPVSAPKNTVMYEIQDKNINRAIFHALTGSDTEVPVILIFPSSQLLDRNKRAREEDMKQLQDAAYQKYIANNCQIRTKTNQGKVVGDSILVAAEILRNPIREAAAKVYRTAMGGHEMPEWMVTFTEVANVGSDIVLGVMTLGVLPVIKYASSKAMAVSGQLINADSTCLKHEFSLEELSRLLFDTEVGLTDRHAFHSFPVSPKPGELKNVRSFVADGVFVHQNVANGKSTVKYMTVDHHGTEYYIREKEPGEYWTFHPFAVKPELVEKRVFFDAAKNKIHFNSEMPPGEGLDYNIAEGKSFINIHGENYEMTWNWNTKQPEIVLPMRNDEVLNVPVYMEPLSKTWHLKTHNGKRVFSEHQERIIRKISEKKDDKFSYISEGNNNPKYYGTGKIYHKEKTGDLSKYKDGDYIEMKGELVRVETKVIPEYGVRYFVYGGKAKNIKELSVEWDGGRWIFERPTSVHVSRKMKKEMTPDMFDRHVDTTRLSAPDDMGLRHDAFGNGYIKVKNNYAVLHRVDNNSFVINGDKKYYVVKFIDNKFVIVRRQNSILTEHDTYLLKNCKASHRVRRSPCVISATESQHLDHLAHAIDLGTPPVSTKVKDIDDGIERLRKIYREDYLQESAAGYEEDLPDLIKYFNENGLYEDFHLSEVFSIYDYGKSGYVRINRELLNPPVSAEIRESANHLELSVRYLSENQANNADIFSEIQDMLPFYRGEVRDFAEIHNLRMGDTYSSRGFMSTSEQQDVAESFIASNLDQLPPDKVNVVYHIQDISKYSGARISDVMPDEEFEFLLLPNTEFKINDIRHDPDNRLFEISLTPTPISQEEFSARLADLVMEKGTGL